ncbi:MAG: hypothetical protein GTO00_09180, partial [Deltaproteobacteria bacterium]|nr:hypothetical protein [Deltaproteobacteria bacterium]
MAKKAEKVYLDESGSESRHANPEARVLLFKFTNGHEIRVQPSALPKEILQCAALHGLGQKIGDAYASSKDVDEAIERAETVVENLTEGTWIDRAEGAVRTSLLAEALQRVLP